MKKRSKKIMDSIISIIKDSAFIILIFIAMTIFISSVLFIFKISINKAIIILAFISTIVLMFYLHKKEKDYKRLIISFVLAIVIVFFSIFINKHTYDTSYDGNSYHKLAIGLLADGYNPVHETAKDFITSGKPSVDHVTNYSKWVEHYPKASWIFTANMYQWTHDMESAKIINMLAIYVTFGICLGFFYKRVIMLFTVILSLFVSLNPVSIVQTFTTYVDGLLGLFLSVLLVSLVALSKREKLDKLDVKKYWIILACTIMICLNLKFTGIVYAGIFCIMFFILWMYKAYKKGKFLKEFKPIFTYYVVVVLISLVLVGFNPYVRNTVYQHNPLYPLMGKNKVDIITYNEPVSFPNRNALDKFFTSMYAKPANYKSNSSDKDPELRWPFITNREEIEQFKVVDLRIGGFGVFFSGVYTIAIIVVGYYLIRMYRKKEYEDANYITGFLIVSLILIIIVDGSWWARYSPYIYLLPVLAIYLLVKDNRNGALIIAVLTTLLLMINNVLIFDVTVEQTVDLYVHVNQYYIKLKKRSDRNGSVDVVLRDDSFSSLLYSFRDKEIKVNLLEDKDQLKNSVYVNHFLCEK